MATTSGTMMLPKELHDVQTGADTSVFLRSGCRQDRKEASRVQTALVWGPI